MKHLGWILCAVVVCLFVVACDTGTPAVATRDTDTRSPDQRTAMRQGLEHSKQPDRQKMPGRLEVGLAVGSIIAMIGVVKYV